MLALGDAELADKLRDFRAQQTAKVLAKTLPGLP
jgi:phosphoribosylcarboxyaminoimidazole (NCAIR) mutase